MIERDFGWDEGLFIDEPLPPCQDCELTYAHEACVVCRWCGKHSERGERDLCMACVNDPERNE